MADDSLKEVVLGISPESSQGQTPNPVRKEGGSQEKEVFVPKDKERGYFESHDIEFHELANGIKVIGSTRNVDDTFNANIAVSFATGAYNDPRGKEGLHHLLEHLIINDELDDTASKLDARFNGETGSRTYRFTLGGPSHPDVHDFGVWPFLPGFRDTLSNPLGHYQKPDEAIVKEKRGCFKGARRARG